MLVVCWCCLNFDFGKVNAATDGDDDDDIVDEANTGEIHHRMSRPTIAITVCTATSLFAMLIYDILDLT